MPQDPGQIVAPDQLEDKGKGKEKGDKPLGDLKLDPALQKGTALQQDPGQIVAPDQLEDKGKGKEKGDRELGDLKLNPALQKGTAVQH